MHAGRILEGMAREKTPAAKSAKKPGRLKQMYQVFQMTRRNDANSIWWMALAFFVPLAVALVVGFILSGTNPLSFALWVVTGVLGGMLAFLIVLGRRAEKAAYSQIKGQPGAVGVVHRCENSRECHSRVNNSTAVGARMKIDSRSTYV